MREAGVDISGHTSKAVDACAPDTLDVVITVCDRAGAACPVFSGAARVLHHAFDDPPALARDARSHEDAMAHYRRVRDEIRRFVQTLPEQIAEATARKGARS